MMRSDMDIDERKYRDSSSAISEINPYNNREVSSGRITECFDNENSDNEFRNS